MLLVGWNKYKVTSCFPYNISMRIQVYVTNRTVGIRRPYPYEELLSFWSYSVPGYQYMKQQRRFRNWDGRVKMLKHDKVPAGLFWATKETIEQELKSKFEIIEDERVWPAFREIELEDNPKYKYQNRCVKRMIRASQTGGGLVLNATGTGKTRIAAMFFKALKGYGLFVVDQLDLLEQAKTEIEGHLGEEVGYIGNSVFEPRRITVATIQTMHRHRNSTKFIAWYQKIKAEIVDEIHVQMNRRNFDVVEKIQPLVVFGLTATLQMKQKPVRIKAQSLCGPVIFEYPLAKGMEAGVLASGVAVRVMYPNPMAPWGKPPWSYQEEYDRGIVANPERNSIVSRLTRYANKKGMYVIVLLERLRHMEKVSARLEDVPHKIVAGTVKGKMMKVAKRLKAQKKFEAGKVRVMIANKVFKKGVNIKRVDVIIDAAGLKSKNDAIQKFGRGVRLHKDKTGLLYFDLSDVDPYVDQIKAENVRIRAKNKLRKKAGKKKSIRELKPNRSHRAAKSRKRAYLSAGITVRDFAWEEDGEVKELWEKACKILKKEVGKKKIAGERSDSGKAK